MTVTAQEVRYQSSVHSLSAMAERLAQVKCSYNTRRIDKSAIRVLLDGDMRPVPGDLLLARITRLGHHKRIELEQGRRAPLFVGDEVMVCYGHRYAPDQFEAEVPSDLRECHLVAAGGIASLCLSLHDSARSPTLIQPLGLLGDLQERPINLSDWALEPAVCQRPRPFVAVVVGTAMNAGKTTSAAHLIKGLSRSGLKVGAAKLTGTGAGGDRWLMKDAGAVEVVDFTDAGFVSTYHASITELEEIQAKLINHLRNKGVEAIVLEIADGLFQKETAALLESARLRANIDVVIFAANDAMGACGGAEWLIQRNLPLVAISGCVSSSPLAAREASMATGLAVLGLEALAAPDIAVALFERCADWVANSTSTKAG